MLREARPIATFALPADTVDHAAVDGHSSRRNPTCLVVDHSSSDVPTTEPAGLEVSVIFTPRSITRLFTKNTPCGILRTP